MAPLPFFTFNPGQGSTSSDATVVEPSAQSSPKPIRSGAGHRRTGSEFIGGDGHRSAGLGLMSSSPTKAEGSLPLPIPADPSSRRGRGRGHSHRRSGAISSHDVSAVFGLPGRRPAGLAESAPTSPIDLDMGSVLAFAPRPPRRGSLDETAGAEESVHGGSSPPRRQRAPGAVPRPRVGFAEHVEFIPRPLSTLSSDTSSSQTTSRGANSITGSMSSLVSVDAASEREVGLSRLVEALADRPLTAGATVSERAAAAAAAAEPSPFAEHRPSVDRPRAAPLAQEICAVSRESDGAESTPLNGQGRQPVVERSAQGRPCASSSPAEVPPPHVIVPEATPDDAEVLRSFEDDRIVTIVNAPVEFLPPPSLEPTRSAPVSPTDTRPAQNGSKYPDIDLDAALGPFDTSDVAASSETGSWDSDGFFSQRRSRGLAGPDDFMASPDASFHRRTESAPAWAGVDGSGGGGRFTVQKWKSISTMADVFEEDEEDGDGDRTEARRASDPVGEPNTVRRIKTVGADRFAATRRTDDWRATTGEQPTASPSDDRSGGSSASNEPRREVEAEAEAETDGDPAAAGREVGGVMDSYLRDIGQQWERDEMEGAAPSPLTTPSTTHTTGWRGEAPNWALFPAYAAPASLPGSSVVSPDLASNAFDRTSIATPSVFTSASSFTDDRSALRSPFVGEPGPDAVRASVDDVPSLTSSNSARTSAVHSYVGPYLTSRPRSGDGVASAVAVRSGSMTSNVTDDGSLQATPRPPVQTKRSSLASLSRLVSGSGTERSKLSIEQTAPTPAPPSSSPEKADKATAGRKGKGLGKIMRFLRPKPNGSPS